VKGLEEHFSQDGLKVIWIGFQDQRSKIIEFMKKHNVSHSVVYDGGNIVARKYGIRYGAGLVLIDREGVVIERISKGFSEIELREVLEGLSAKEARMYRESAIETGEPLS
jgi:peroxiredoxin